MDPPSCIEEEEEEVKEEEQQHPCTWSNSKQQQLPDTASTTTTVTTMSTVDTVMLSPLLTQHAVMIAGPEDDDPTGNSSSTSTSINTNTATRKQRHTVNGSTSSDHHTCTFVSHYRTILDHIHLDRLQSRCHAVPNTSYLDLHNASTTTRTSNAGGRIDDDDHHHDGDNDDNGNGNDNSDTETRRRRRRNNNNNNYNNHNNNSRLASADVPWMVQRSLSSLNLEILQRNEHAPLRHRSRRGLSSWRNHVGKCWFRFWSCSLSQSSSTGPGYDWDTDHHDEFEYDHNYDDDDDDQNRRKLLFWRCRCEVESVLPMWRWLKVYDWRQSLGHDILAGLTVAIMIIPQSMSYAKLAGLPVEYGLYSSFCPLYAYALFGTSRQLAVGPVALISLLLSTSLSILMESEFPPGTDHNSHAYQTRYCQLAVQVSFLVGLVNIAMGLVRMGFVTMFLSSAVISGFTTGAATIIGFSQVKYILGVDTTRSDRLHHILYHLIEVMDQFNYKTFLMGTMAMLAIIQLKNVSKSYPRFNFVRAIGPLLVTTISIVLVIAFRLDQKGIPIVGHIPVGLPRVTVHDWFPIQQQLDKMFVLVMSIVIVGFMESISIAKQLSSKHKYDIDASSELLGLGVANLAGAIFQAYPVTGSFSRSAVNNDTGAQSGISGLVTATMIGVVLLLLTPIFEKLPLNILAAIVISGVLGLLDYPEAMYLYKVHHFDFAVWCIACLGTMFLGVEIGLTMAVGVSLVRIIYESAYPHMTILGRLPGTTVYRNIRQYPNAERYDGIVMIRINGPLHFANAHHVRDKICKYCLRAEQRLARKNARIDAAIANGEYLHPDHDDDHHHHHHAPSKIKYLILDMSPVSHIDTSALHVLKDMVVNYQSRRLQICFSNPALIVMQRMVSSGLADCVGQDHFFVCLHDAVHWSLQQMDDEAITLHESRHGSLSLTTSSFNMIGGVDIGTEDIHEEFARRHS